LNVTRSVASFAGGVDGGRTIVTGARPNRSDKGRARSAQSARYPVFERLRQTNSGFEGKIRRNRMPDRSMIGDERSPPPVEPGKIAILRSQGGPPIENAPSFVASKERHLPITDFGSGCHQRDETLASARPGSAASSGTCCRSRWSGSAGTSRRCR
jgi:hypothetical protein